VTQAVAAVVDIVGSMPRLRGWLHAATAPLALVAGAVLVAGSPDGAPRIGTLVFAVSALVLFSVSATMHRGHWSPRTSLVLRRLDHASIFLLIAGTYTPLCLVPLRGPLGWALLVAVWSLAAVGIFGVWAWRSRKTWARVTLYLCMGWLCLLATGEIFRTFPASAIGWLIAGGVFYSVGAAVFVTDRPHLWPGRFMAHDLWHVMVLAASACHFMVMLEFIAPHA